MLMLILLWGVALAFAVYYYHRIRRTPGWQRHDLPTKIELVLAPLPVLVGVVGATAAIYPALSAIDLTARQQQRDLRQQIAQATQDTVHLYSALLFELEQATMTAGSLRAALANIDRDAVRSELSEFLSDDSPTDPETRTSLDAEAGSTATARRQRTVDVGRQQAVLGNRLRDAVELLGDIVLNDFAYRCYIQKWEVLRPNARVAHVYRRAQLTEPLEQYSIMLALGILQLGIERTETVDEVELLLAEYGAQSATQEILASGDEHPDVVFTTFLSVLIAHVPDDRSYLGLALLGDLVAALPNGDEIADCARTYYQGDEDLVTLAENHVVQFLPANFAPRLTSSLEVIDESEFCYVLPCVTPPADSTLLTVGEEGVDGHLGNADDRHWYRFTVTETASYNIRTGQVDDREPVDTIIVLVSADESEFGSDDDSGDGQYSLLRRELVPGEYYVRVEPFAAETGWYRLAVTISEE